MNKRFLFWALTLLPVIAALVVWFSPLAFVPVPWPDDSAFYFVAHDFFRWPPRWVMLPQAPFEPSYAQFNFNTMPLYPLLIGVGRWLGIDGSFALKFWPLSAWALSGSLLIGWLLRKEASWIAVGALSLAFAADPTLRWASVLVRPESLIGLFGLVLVMGISLGFPKRFQPRGWWDPVAALLALAAYCHFNAIHLLFPVLLAFALQPRRLVSIGAKAVLYLSPWLVLVIWHLGLFRRQMETQWTRLAVPNEWLSTFGSALGSLFQGMGAPEPLPDVVSFAGITLWLLILAAVGAVAAFVIRGFSRTPPWKLLPAAGWVVSAVWLWHTKPEVWFTYYIHVASWTFAGLIIWTSGGLRGLRSRKITISAMTAVLLATSGLFVYGDVAQAVALSRSYSWKWSTYHDFVSCVDAELSRLDERLGHPKTFRVWDPTFPDVTIELSRRHPRWQFTRTNDFTDREALALRHGDEVEAMVVTETLDHVERQISGPARWFPNVQSIWMQWEPYYLHKFLSRPGWKPNRYICQRGRWQAFIYMDH